ncbi:MAG: 6-phosphogluconolactonase [Flavobacteriales bacterium]|nr:6-phosphogluconolactonase [Flavobacteriales bacterium]
MTQRKFLSSSELDQAFAKWITDTLSAAIVAGEEPVILFSGGSTPAGLLKLLAKSTLTWTRVKVGLVDDRMVPLSSEFSNGRMIQTLLIDALPESNRPRFMNLVTHPYNASNNLAHAIKSAQEYGTPCITILGMGADGHFASLFPGDDASTRALKEIVTEAVLYTQAPSNPRFRISHSWAYLKKSKHLMLHFTGVEKMHLLEEHEQREPKLPIDYLVEDTQVSPVLYWAP